MERKLSPIVKVRVRPESIKRHCDKSLEECAFDDLLFATVNYVNDFDPNAEDIRQAELRLWRDLQSCLINYGCFVEPIIPAKPSNPEKPEGESSSEV